MLFKFNPFGGTGTIPNFPPQLSKPEGTPLKAFESVLVTDMVTAIETLRSQERVRQPPNVTKPDDVFEREGRKSAAELFTGEDALKYITNLAILRNKRRERETEEGESGRREREDIERRLREEMMKVELDGSLEEFLKKKRSEEGENEFEKKVHYEPNQLDITPLMQKVSQRFLFSTAHVRDMLCALEAKALCNVFYDCVCYIVLSFSSLPIEKRFLSCIIIQTEHSITALFNVLCFSCLLLLIFLFLGSQPHTSGAEQLRPSADCTE